MRSCNTNPFIVQRVSIKCVEYRILIQTDGILYVQDRKVMTYGNSTSHCPPTPGATNWPLIICCQSRLSEGLLQKHHDVQEIIHIGL